MCHDENMTLKICATKERLLKRKLTHLCDTYDVHVVLSAVETLTRYERDVVGSGHTRLSG